MEHIEESRAKRFERRMNDVHAALASREHNRRQDTCLALVKLVHAVAAGKSELRPSDVRRLDSMVDELEVMVRHLHAAMYREFEYEDDIIFPDDESQSEDMGETGSSEAVDGPQSETPEQEEAEVETDASAPAESFKTTPTEVPTALPKDSAPVMPEQPAEAVPAEDETESEGVDEPATPESAAEPETETSEDEGPEWDAPSEADQRAYDDAMSDALGKGSISVE